MSLSETRLAATRIMAKHLFDVSPRMSSLFAARLVPCRSMMSDARSFDAASPDAASFDTASLHTLHRSIELLYYRTSVPSNERLVREANVNATVAGTVTQRSGRARAIRNQGSRAVQRRR